MVIILIIWLCVSYAGTNGTQKVVKNQEDYSAFGCCGNKKNIILRLLMCMCNPHPKIKHYGRDPYKLTQEQRRQRSLSSKQAHFERRAWREWAYLNKRMPGK